MKRLQRLVYLDLCASYSVNLIDIVETNSGAFIIEFVHSQSRKRAKQILAKHKKGLRPNAKTENFPKSLQVCNLLIRIKIYSFVRTKVNYICTAKLEP